MKKFVPIVQARMEIPLLDSDDFCLDKNEYKYNRIHNHWM